MDRKRLLLLAADRRRDRRLLRLLRHLRRRHRAVAAGRGDHDARRRRDLRRGDRHGLVSFASSIGATLAFLVSRFLLRDWVQARIGEKLKRSTTASPEGRRVSTCSRCGWCRSSRSS
jgi:hypothetical protein